MISVLIPVYNYDVVELVETVHNQLELCNIAFEIKCMDDASDIGFHEKNKHIETLSHTTYDISLQNKGRIATRQALAQSASYGHLLFLDADVSPKSDHFISTYVKYVDSDHEAIYGGVAYKKEAPENDYLLRWTYGKLKEEVASVKRNETPYKSIVSANFLIRKSTFITLNGAIAYKGYGSDNHFSAQLKENQISVLHIDNYVYHLGIEKSSIYLKKKEEAALALIALYRSQDTTSHNNQLLTLFTKLKRFKLNHPMALFYKVFHSKLKRNLLGKNPSVNYLQLYRIGYMCYKDLNP